jgi:aspartate-alanine antiporter
MMTLISNFLRHYPEAAIFLAVAVGVKLGRIKLGGFSLGNATAVLIVATIIGAAVTGPLGLSYPPLLKAIAFALFVFAVGFHGGPQFFGSFGLTTLTQVAFAIFVAAVGLASTLTASYLLGLDKGSAAGLAAGALTQTAMIGTALAALSSMNLSPAAIAQAQSDATVSYALTYIFGTAAVIAFTGQIAPRLMGVSLKEEARKLEAELAGGSVVEHPHALAYRRFDSRAYQVERGAGMNVAAVEAGLGERAVVRTIRRDKTLLEPTPDTVLRAGDEVALTARRAGLLAAATLIGPELEGQQLLEPVEGAQTRVVLTQKNLAGRTLEEFVKEAGDMARGVYLVAVMRGGRALPIGPGLRMMMGDILELVGRQADVSRVTTLIGVKYPHTERSDLAWLALGLLGGTMLGALTLKSGGLILTLGGGGGILIGGLLAGWYNSRHPLVGGIPHEAVRLIWDLGLALFVALLGLTAGPSAVAALVARGPGVLIAGVVVTLIPLVTAVYFGRYVLRMNPVILCGALAGSMTQDAAMLAASEIAESATPVLGFTVPYAIANVLLTLLGPIIVGVT